MRYHRGRAAMFVLPELHFLKATEDAGRGNEDIPKNCKNICHKCFRFKTQRATSGRLCRWNAVRNVKNTNLIGLPGLRKKLGHVYQLSFRNIFSEMSVCSY